MKQFYKYIITLLAILSMATTHAWAAATCHTITKATFTTDASYTKKSWGITYTYYYYSQPQQQFLQITDNGYSTLSSVTFTVTGDKNNGEQNFKILYNTGSGWQYYDNNNYSLSRGGLLQGYPAGSITITLSDTKIKSATAFGIEFTNYNTNSSGDTNQRTITISEVNVTFSNYFHSDANGTTLEAFPSTEKGKTCTTTRSFTYNYNNTVTSVNWTSNNSMFTVSSSHAEDCSGEKTVTITFKPTEIRSEITGTITGTDNNGNKIIVYVTGSSWGKEDPTYTWNADIWNGTSQARTIYVGETINNLLTYTSSQADCTYSLKKLEDGGINNGDAVTTFGSNTLVAGRAGKYRLIVTQPEYLISETSGYNAGADSIELTISKHQTNLSLNLQDTYFVDEEDNTVFTTNNTDVTVIVSDKTSNDRSLFTYSNGILKANGATLSADAETSTITITQPENYKWTAATQTKQVTVKKHTTEFAWQLQDSYFVGEEDASIFTKSDNNLASTITSSDPSVIEVVDNKLVMHKVGSAVITVSQATDRKWTDFSYTKTVNVVKRDLEAAIRQSSAVWNELISDPFTVSFKHPITGAVTTLTDYTVTQTEDSKLIAEYKSSKIQTYYTNGTVSFQITRPEDNNYNALNQTLTLTVATNNNGCYVVENESAEAEYSIGQNSNGTFSKIITLNGIGNILTFKYCLNSGATSEHYITPQYSTTDSEDNFQDIPNSQKTTKSNTAVSSGNITIPDGTKRIRFKRTAATGGTKSFTISEIYVTRQTFLTPSVTSLTLDPTISNKRSEKTFTLDWSTCADEIKVISTNPYLQVSVDPINAFEGKTSITVYCKTDVLGNHEGEIVIYDQTQKKVIPVSCLVKEVTIPDFKGDDKHEMKVGDTWNANFEFIRTQGNIPTFSETAENTGFYYYIEHNVTTDNITGSEHPDKVIQYTPTYNDGVVINTITALNKGTAILHIIQAANAEYQQGEFICTITVDKTTPTFVWKDPVYFNQTIIPDYFETDNKETELIIESPSSDPEVAELYFSKTDATDKHTLDLTTYYKETTPASSTQVTVSQAENWKWYAHEETKTITPKNENNHVTFTIDDANHTIFENSLSDQARWKNNGYQLGDGGWTDRTDEVVIAFTGIPDTLYFDKILEKSVGQLPGTYLCRVYESANGSDWGEHIWERNEREESYTGKVPLSSTTKYVKFYYNGTVYCNYRNITVTELNQFEAAPTTLDFGTVTLDDNPNKTLNFNLHYANAGYNVTLDLDRTDGWATEEAYNLAKQYIRIEPATITNIGGEKYGTVENIQVTLHSNDQTGYTIPADARLKISDEAGHTTYVNLFGKIEQSTQTITWNNYFSLTEPIQIPISTDTVRGAAKASSNLPVKYRSADDAVIKVSDNGSCFIPAGVGTTTITAYQEGNAQYAYIESTKRVQVTEKSIQLINWTDDLSDLIFYQNTEDPDSIALTAQVYIIDVVNSTFEFSQEQTDKLVYTIGEGGESIIKITNDTLTMLGIGETTITVTIEADEHHEGATMTIPVIVREPAIGCEDILLLDQADPVEIFTEGINTNQVTKDPIAIDRSKGVPGYLKFEHKGEYWKLTGLINYYDGNIKAQQSTDGGTTWTDVPGSEIKPTVGTYNPTSLLPIDRNATHIRFVRPDGGQGYHYYRNVQVWPAQYLEANTTSIDFESINMGGLYEKTFTISYSNIKSPLIGSTSSPADVKITPNRFGECSGFGTQEITVTWTPNSNQNQSITFRDTLANLSVTIDLIANIQLRKQKIIWENRPTAILDHTGIDNRPLYTRDANNNELLDLPITYEVTNGSDLAYFENGMFFIINTGEITIKASNLGNNEYLAVDSTYQLIIQGIPPTFIGSTEASANSLWTNQNNWVNGLMPTEDNTANIVAPVQVNTAINVQGVRVAEEGTIHITKEGGLTIGEKGIQTVTTDGSAIVIDNLHEGAGFVRVNPAYKGTMPRITMRYQPRSTLDHGANKDAEWQYIGAPGKDATIYVDYGTWLYKHDEASADWILEERMDSAKLEPFKGYSITQYGQPTYEWTAELTTENCTIPLTYHKNGRSGRHIIANSYAAPINVAAFNGDEFQYLDADMENKYRIDKTLYIYNSGSWKQWHEHDSLGTSTNATGGTTTTPGQYYAIPVLAAGENYLEGLQTTITPMQGIYLRVRSKTPLLQLPTEGEKVGQLVLNYEQLVTGESHEMHRPMRTPAMQDPNFRRVRIIATSENSGTDHVYIIQDNINTRKYNNGYDAPNQEATGLVNIYTNETGGKMEVSCSNNIDSMYIGFMAGEDRTYTLHFSAIIGDVLYLQDLDNGQKISIVEGTTYTFDAEPLSTNHNRFLLLISPNTTTDLDQIESANIWYSNQTLYITNAPYNSVLTLYSISGQPILSTTIQHTPYSIDLSHLAEGVYMARVNNQVYKFVCK